MYGVLIAIGMAAFIGPFACPWPDGLDRVAEKLGFSGHEAARRLIGSPMPNYHLPGISSATVATALAGVVGTVVAFGLGLFLAHAGAPSSRNGTGRASESVMHSHFLENYSGIDSPIHRVPTLVKMIVCVGLIIICVTLPMRDVVIFASIAMFLFLVAAASLVPGLFLLKRLIFLEPIVLAAAMLSLFQPNGGRIFATLVVRSSLCITCLTLLANTTPLGEMLVVLKRLRLPSLLITTIALMHRYLFVLHGRIIADATGTGEPDVRSLACVGVEIAGDRLFATVRPIDRAGRAGVCGDVRAGVEVNPCVEVKNLCYHYADGTEALKDVSFSVGQGECAAIIGPNGAGKSTLLLHLNGLLPDARDAAGSVVIDGMVVNKQSASEIRRKVGLVFQDPDDQLFCATVFEDVAFGPRQFATNGNDLRPRVAEALKQVGLTGFEKRSPHRLSGGEKRRVCLAGVLACEPSVLVLDEPTSGLDPRGRREFKALLRALPATKIIATHDLEMVVELCCADDRDGWGKSRGGGRYDRIVE